MEKKLNGAELIAKERQEQIEKHGYTIQEDTNRYDEDITGKHPQPSDLITAATASIFAVKSNFPYSWRDSPFIDKICRKKYRDRLVIAGALIAAEIDRLIAKWDK